VVCHGIPGERTLREGDIANIDVTVIVDGWHGDTAACTASARRPARPPPDRDHLRGPEARPGAVKPGATPGRHRPRHPVLRRIQRCSVVRDFCGHGLGKVFHDAPNILHFGRPGQGEVLKPGMFFTVEPMVNLGKSQVKLLADGWTAVTRDKSLSAQCEHSIGVTEDGVEIFTPRPTGPVQAAVPLDNSGLIWSTDRLRVEGRHGQRHIPGHLGRCARRAARAARQTYPEVRWPVSRPVGR
jgi:methionyl aminopeptidase